MTRTTPLLTLAAVALTGVALLSTRYLGGAPAPEPVPASAGVVPDPVAVAGSVPEPVPQARAAAGPTYAGWTAGMGFTVALAVTGPDVVAYVCDGEQVEVWLSGTLTDGDLQLANADGTASLTGTADADGAAGTVVRDGAEWSFSAEPMSVEEAAAAGRGDVGQVAERALSADPDGSPDREPAVGAPAVGAPVESPAVEDPAAPQYPVPGY